ncbi:MAG: hypothetical protein HRT58_06210 [Crocinitomicaceae bacterium]|nr:hypothetical protein [Flavobacteriales bacterium]NQZ35237.1 hypothetical protein [Crocinitomicaceae bacterium]
MEPLSSFGISLAAGIVIEVYKVVGKTKVNAEINTAFKESLKVFSPNSDVRESDRKKIKEHIQELIKEPNLDLRSNAQIGDYSRFFKIFEEVLATKPSAYAFLKEARDEGRYLEILKSIEGIDNRLQELFENSSPSDQLESEYKRQLLQYRQNLERFKPSVALSNLTALEASFDQHNFVPSNEMKSSLEFLKSRCLELIPDNDRETNLGYIKAYKLNENNIEVKERACFSYFKIEENDKALILKDEILELDEYSPVAWVVNVLTREGNSLVSKLIDVPKFVIEDLTFKRLLFYHCSRDKTFDDLKEAFEQFEIIVGVENANDLPTCYENYKEKMFIVECALNDFSQRVYLDFRKTQIDRERALPIFNVLENFLEGVKNSEIESSFDAVKFFHSFLDYTLNEDRDAVYRMKEFYIQVKSKGGLPLMLMANSLQIIGDEDSAIDIIGDQEDKTIESLSLELFCLAKKERKDEFVISVREFLTKLKEVDENQTFHIFSIVDTLAQFHKLSEIELSEFMDDKKFSPESIRLLLSETIKIYREQSDDQTLSNLKIVENELLPTDSSLKGILARTYYLLKEFKSCLIVSETYINKTVESEELFNYMHSLFMTSSDHKQLLELLAKWRLDFSFSPGLLRMEVELRRQLFDSETCLEICEFFLEKIKDDEFILANYAIAIHESDQAKDELNKLVELVEGFEFNGYNNAQTIAKVLLAEFPLKALEIYFNQAKDKRKAQARTDYFMSTIRMPKNTLEDYKSVELGHYVKYKMDDQVNFVELTEEHPFAKQLVGKNVGETIQVKRRVGNSTKPVTILRIMNKYLSLHDEILNEVDKNPLTEIPMESFNMQDYMGEGQSILDFFKELGGDSNYDEEKTFKDYYASRLSFTEIVACQYSQNFIRAYFNLEYDKSGIVQLHPMTYPNLDLNFYDHFVLDFTSLLRLFSLSDEKGKKFNIKFKLTRSAKSLVRSYADENMPYSGSGYLLDKNFYTKLLSWIETNCESMMAVSKLDIAANLPKEFNGDPVRNQLLDHCSLMLDLDKSLLISDDSMNLKFFPQNSGRIISTDLFIMKCLADGKISE